MRRALEITLGCLIVAALLWALGYFVGWDTLLFIAGSALGSFALAHLINLLFRLFTGDWLL